MRFTLFRIPITVEPWFFLGLLFVYSMARSSAGSHQAGLIAAAAVGVLTLVHELGHALTAKSFGCESSISLNLFVGFASFTAPRPLSRSQSIAISLAGPFAQLAGGVVALGVAHNRFHATGGDIWKDAWIGLSWAGVAIAVLNLLPLWPLDGGHVMHQLIGSIVGSAKALRYTIYSTFAILGLMLIVGMLGRGDVAVLERMRTRAIAGLYDFRDPNLFVAIRGLFRSMPLYVLEIPWFLVAISALTCFQTLGQLRSDTGDARAAEVTIAALTAETKGWLSASIPAMPRGWLPSPWLQAYVAARAGNSVAAADALSRVGADGRWVLPDPQSRPELASLVPLLGSQVALTNRSHSYTLARVLRVYGMPAQFLDLCRALYDRYRDPELLYMAAGGLAVRGHPDDAMAWLRRAASEAPDYRRLMTDASLLALHGRADFHELLRLTAR